MLAVVVEFRIKAEMAAAFLERVCRQARDSLDEEPGCHVFDVCVDPDAPTRVLLYEIYEDRQAFDDHLRTEHFLAFDRDVGEWVVDKTVRLLRRV